jgi:SAM-dependent methyltransferase
MKQDKTIWFKDWFNSPYYHILYKNRDCAEADFFINNMILFFKPNQNVRFLDLACGKGRHSIFLNKKGFDVTGLDLSENSIKCAKQFENEKLHFYVHDMRKLFRTNYFDYVLNLFTSFGYFENEKDNYATIGAAAKALKPNGLLVIDFFNAKKVIDNLVLNEKKEVEGILFNINKKVENGFIIKQISFNTCNQDYLFEEKVQALTLMDFEKYMEASKLKIVNLLGNYGLDSFDENTSDRLIIIAQKQA